MQCLLPEPRLTPSLLSPTGVHAREGWPETAPPPLLQERIHAKAEKQAAHEERLRRSLYAMPEDMRRNQ